MALRRMFPYSRAPSSAGAAMKAEYRDILFDVPEPMIGRVTLNRPDKMNAYTGRMCDDIVAALVDYIERDDLRCLVITGAGRGFCSVSYTHLRAHETGRNL